MKRTFQTFTQLFSNKRGTLLFIWLGWALAMIGYQAYVIDRFDLQIRDRSLWWTEYEVNPVYQSSYFYLTQPYLNEHVAWDSFYYISIAVGGYHDPIMRSIPPDYSRPDNPQMMPQQSRPDWISMNYAFFPLYPWASRILAYPLKIIGVHPIATALYRVCWFPCSEPWEPCLRCIPWPVKTKGREAGCGQPITW